MFGQPHHMTEPGSQHAELLTTPRNFAVVQLPERASPGVVVQGDSLSALCEQAALVAAQAAGSPAADEALDLSEQLDEILNWYISVLSRRGMTLPFAYRPSPK